MTPEETAHWALTEHRCPLCHLGHEDRSGLVGHLAGRHGMSGGQAVCACGRTFRTDGYQRTHRHGREKADPEGAQWHQLLVSAITRPPAPRPPQRRRTTSQAARIPVAVQAVADRHGGTVA